MEKQTSSREPHRATKQDKEQQKRRETEAMGGTGHDWTRENPSVQGRLLHSGGFLDEGEVEQSIEGGSSQQAGRD